MTDETGQNEEEAEMYAPCTSPRLLTYREVGRMLAVGRTTIYKLVADNRLERFKFPGGQTSPARITRASVEALLAAGGVRPDATDGQLDETGDAK